MPLASQDLTGMPANQKNIAALKIAYCSFPTILVSKANTGMKKKIKCMGKESSVIFG